MPYETGAPGFHKRGPGIHRIASVLHRGKTKVLLRHSAAAPRSTPSLERGVKKKKKTLLPQCVPSHCLFAITEGDVIAWHDEIVYVKVHFIQMCNQKKERNSCVRTQMHITLMYTHSHSRRIRAPTCIT